MSLKLMSFGCCREAFLLDITNSAMWMELNFVKMLLEKRYTSSLELWLV